MKTAMMLAMLTFNVIPAKAGELGILTDRRVVICSQSKPEIAIARAQQLAVRMFLEAGVTIQFLSNPKTCPPDAIRVTFPSNTSETLLPGALAYALPYEHVHIQVFFDRVQRIVVPAIVPYVLAHVLVHEITHMIEGIDCHTVSGVMKASWTGRDYAQMARAPLGFTPEDLVLIHDGLKNRAARLRVSGEAAGRDSSVMH